MEFPVELQLQRVNPLTSGVRRIPAVHSQDGVAPRYSGKGVTPANTRHPKYSDERQVNIVSGH